MYADGDYDLAGFCVGIVERGSIIDGARTAPGDLIVAVASSGPHSNGYSLIRSVLDASGDDLDRDIDGIRLIDALLAPTRIYSTSVLSLIRGGDVHAVAHVTGGGIVENLPRVLPAGTCAVIDASSWRRPAVFEWVRDAGGIAEDEMWRTFNCGVGMLLVTAPDSSRALVEALEANGERAWVAGQIHEGGSLPEVRIK
jgi:phosphoribosylformylglycinamidine cyclo-ligase